MIARNSRPSCWKAPSDRCAAGNILRQLDELQHQLKDAERRNDTALRQPDCCRSGSSCGEPARAVGETRRREFVTCCKQWS